MFCFTAMLWKTQHSVQARLLFPQRGSKEKQHKCSPPWDSEWPRKGDDESDFTTTWVRMAQLEYPNHVTCWGAGRTGPATFTDTERQGCPSSSKGCSSSFSLATSFRFCLWPKHLPHWKHTPQSYAQQLTQSKAKPSTFLYNGDQRSWSKTVTKTQGGAA